MLSSCTPKKCPAKGARYSVSPIFWGLNTFALANAVNLTISSAVKSSWFATIYACISSLGTPGYNITACFLYSSASYSGVPGSGVPVPVGTLGVWPSLRLRVVSPTICLIGDVSVVSSTSASWRTLLLPLLNAPIHVSSSSLSKPQACSRASAASFLSASVATPDNPSHSIKSLIFST